VKVTIGRAARQAVTAGRPGRVVAVFSQAIYVRFADASGIIAIVPATVPSGPLHLHVESLPKAAVGDPVMVGSGALVVGGHHIDIPEVVWIPTPVDGLPDQRQSAALVLRDVLGEPRLLDLSGTGWDVSAHLHQHGLRATVAQLAGRGSGLTPAGDDCAAGVVLVTALLSEAGWATWSTWALAELACSHASHEIAVALLSAAARGEGIEPLHELLVSCALGDRDAAMRDVQVLDGIGHTSGRDMAYGMLLGLECADVIADDWRADRDRLSSTSQSAT
jgi:hypothetical protein